MEMKSYVQPLADSSWGVDSDSIKTIFDWDYAAGRDKLERYRRELDALSS